jgi:predicted lipoprotein with Yx(FWY)xxD motif
MTASFRLVCLASAVAVLIAACTGAAASPAPPTAAPATPAASAQPASSGAGASAGPVVVGSATTTLGVVLTGPTGLTLYTKTGDSTTASTCTGACLSAWPPLTVPAGQQPTAGSGVTGTLASFTRPEGVQVTYDGLPLYYWKGDAKPGDVTGQGKGGFSVALAAGMAAPASAPASKAAPTASGYGY